MKFGDFLAKEGNSAAMKKLIDYCKSDEFESQFGDDRHGAYDMEDRMNAIAAAERDRAPDRQMKNSGASASRRAVSRCSANWGLISIEGKNIQETNKGFLPRAPRSGTPT